MKVKVVYATKTGHSKKIANAISQGLQIDSINIKSAPKFESVDMLFIVGGIYGGQSLPEMVEFAKSLDSNKVKKVALITSSMSKDAPQSQIRKVILENKVDVLTEEFFCQGSFLFFKLGHPNKTELSDAVEFAKKYLPINNINSTHK